MTTPLRERRRRLLRDEILQAANMLLNEKGYAAMSMDELASCAGISKPTLYSHFTNKEDLILAAVMGWFDQMELAVKSDPTPRTPLQELTFVLRTVVQLQIDNGALSPRPWSPELFQVIRHRQEVVARLHQVTIGISDLVKAAMQSGEINARLDPGTIVRVFFSLIHTLNSPFFKPHLIDSAISSGPTALNPAIVADTLATIFEQGVRASDL